MFIGSLVLYSNTLANVFNNNKEDGPFWGQMVLLRANKPFSMPRGPSRGQQVPKRANGVFLRPLLSQLKNVRFLKAISWGQQAPPRANESFLGPMSPSLGPTGPP